MTDLTEILRYAQIKGEIRLSRGINDALRVEVPNILAVNVQCDSEEEMREITQALVNAITSKPC